MNTRLKVEGLEGTMEGLFCPLGGLLCGCGRIGRINKPTPQHMCALTYGCNYISIILPILPSLDSISSTCSFYPSKTLPHPSKAAIDLWTMERPAAGEDAQVVAWHIAYLLAGPLSPEEVTELARLRRVQRWLVAAPERRAALRVALVAASAVRLAITVMGGVQ
jgi:hypothetical protein